MVCSICLSRPAFFLNARVIFFFRWIFSGSPIIKTNWSDTLEIEEKNGDRFHSFWQTCHLQSTPMTNALTSTHLLNGLLIWKWCCADLHYCQYAVSLLKIKRLLNSVKSFDLISKFNISSKHECWCSIKSLKATISVSIVLSTSTIHPLWNSRYAEPSFSTDTDEYKARTSVDKVTQKSCQG